MTEKQRKKDYMVALFRRIRAEIAEEEQKNKPTLPDNAAELVAYHFHRLREKKKQAENPDK